MTAVSLLVLLQSSRRFELRADTRLITAVKVILLLFTAACVRKTVIFRGWLSKEFTTKGLLLWSQVTLIEKRKQSSFESS